MTGDKGVRSSIEHSGSLRAHLSEFFAEEIEKIFEGPVSEMMKRENQCLDPNLERPRDSPKPLRDEEKQVIFVERMIRLNNEILVETGKPLDVRVTGEDVMIQTTKLFWMPGRMLLRPIYLPIPKVEIKGMKKAIG
ncbi:hypothetical protein Acr_01g0012890 [Actinidia rufa]|uniref:Uncharacterized protein n=1 Tax=Actinidia rufa TaxID=165716 RepID=A0A7J0E4Y4_9ERIC|nr:hypothetical protein Acr_01g0012890 [Actinidia rufa]